MKATRLYIVLVLATLVAIGYCWWNNKSSPMLWGGLLAALFGVCIVAPGVFRGEDDKPSTSKFQSYLWTLAVAFAFGVFLCLKWGPLRVKVNLEIPDTLIGALGLSAATMLGAKGITSHNVTTKAMIKGGAESWNPLYLLSDDEKNVQLTKVQLLFWTLVAIGAFLRDVIDIANRATWGGSALFPEVEPVLLTLAGVGQATYLGRKLMDK